MTALLRISLTEHCCSAAEAENVHLSFFLENNISATKCVSVVARSTNMPRKSSGGKRVSFALKLLFQKCLFFRLRFFLSRIFLDKKTHEDLFFILFGGFFCVCSEKSMKRVSMKNDRLAFRRFKTTNLKEIKTKMKKIIVNRFT